VNNPLDQDRVITDGIVDVMGSKSPTTKAFANVRAGGILFRKLRQRATAPLQLGDVSAGSRSIIARNIVADLSEILPCAR
jgi:hypothetical protein